MNKKLDGPQSRSESFGEVINHVYLQGFSTRRVHFLAGSSANKGCFPLCFHFSGVRANHIDLLKSEQLLIKGWMNSIRQPILNTLRTGDANLRF